MFDLKVDEELHLRNIHPDDAEALFDLIERNRARLRLWIDPYSLPETAKAARLFTIHCLFNFYGDPNGPSELDQYHLELESYFPPQIRPIDLGVWVHGELAGSLHPNVYHPFWRPLAYWIFVTLALITALLIVRKLTLCGSLNPRAECSLQYRTSSDIPIFPEPAVSLETAGGIPMPEMEKRLSTPRDLWVYISGTGMSNPNIAHQLQ